MQLYTALYILHCGILCFVQGQILRITTLFRSGNVEFRWTPSSNSSYYYVFITRDRSTDARTRVSNTQYTVKDAILYDSITINVRTPESLADNVVTYNVSKVQSQIGGRTNISWTAAFFPYATSYNIYHIYKENRTTLIIRVYRERVILSIYPKYAYLTRPLNSTNIMFEIRNIKMDDAGYYNGGMISDHAGFGGGVILIVSGTPKKPRINGTLTTLVDTYLELTCISKSTSAPDYYSKLVTLSYTWFINNTKMDKETRDTLRLKVTKGHKYTRYSCTATEEDLESYQSDAVQINPLYGPEQLIFTPKPNLNKYDKFTVKEGDVVGPIFCSADCNPPCNVTWKYKESNGLKDALSQNGILLQSVNRNVTQILCSSRWKTESVEKDFTLDVQYIDDPIIYANDEWVSDRITVDIQEKNPLQLSCLVNGNPIPTVRLGKSQNGGTVILSEARDHWSNYSFGAGAHFSDTGTYVCYGQSKDLKTNTKTIDVNILCEPRLDKEVEMKTISESAKARIVIIPIVAYPSPVLSKLVWLGPDDLPTNFTTTAVFQLNGVNYNHRVISIISGLEDEKFGEYKLLYEGKVLTNVFIRREEYEMSRGHKIVIVVLSTILGITWLLIITYVIFKKQRLLLHKTDKLKSKSHQLETQISNQHYDDLQDTGVDKTYTALDRNNQESTYEETL